tara:strand:+ start:102 stop:677 length:576 start_codon:yes stop_codon:yes gene_type:complete
MKVAFCIPGNSFTPRFLANWTTLTNELTNRKIEFWLSTGYVPVVHTAREVCLDIINSGIDFTHVMWIDSDIDFTPDDFFRLESHNKPVISGVYKMLDNNYSCQVNGEWMDDKLRTSNINCCAPSLIEADFCGMGWMLTQIEVYKKLKHPYFDMSTKKHEDELFCKKLQKHGYKVNVDPSILVGHEKLQVLR